MRERPATSRIVGGTALALAFVFVGIASAWQEPRQQSQESAAIDTASQTGGTTSEGTDGTAVADKIRCPGLSKVFVTDAYRVRDHKERPPREQPALISHDVKLRDTIAVKMKNLQDLTDQVRCEEEKGHKRNIILYLADRPLQDVVAYPPTGPERGLVMFPLRRTEASRDLWTYLLGKPGWGPREVEVSVGLDEPKGYAVSSDAKIMLHVIPHNWFNFWALLFGALVIGFFILAQKSDVLRDPAPVGPEARRPYSLSRTQAAWWFFLILGSYLFIGMITGDFSTSITGTVLVLLGISAGTAVGSAFVDASKEDKGEAERKVTLEEMDRDLVDLDLQIQAADAALRANPQDPLAQQALADLRREQPEKLRQIQELRKFRHSHHFLLDILSDANGVNFHRFQIAAWTVVLGIIFVGQVFRELAMPQFDGTLLGLMGISAGTYLGLKIPEDTVPDTPPTK